MGLFDKIFGGSESKTRTDSSAKSATQTSALNQALDLFTSRLGQQPNVFQGLRVAPLTLEQKAASDVGGFIPSLGPRTSANIPLFDETQTALGGLLAGETGAAPLTPADTQSFFSRAIEDPARQQFEDFIKPEIREAFAGPGFFSSGRAIEQGRAAEQLGRDLTSRRAALEFDVLQQNQQLEEAKANRTLSSISSALQLGREPVSQTQQALAARGQVAALGGITQQQAQNEINASIQKFAEENRLTDPEDMQILLALLGMNFGTNVSKVDQYQTPGALAGISGFFGGGTKAPAAAFIG